MNDQPSDQVNDRHSGNSALEQRLRRYYDARRAAGLAADELRARVAARLASEGAPASSRMPLSIHKEPSVLTRRSNTPAPSTGPVTPRPSGRRGGGRAAGIAALLATAAVIALAALIFSSLRPAA